MANAGEDQPQMKRQKIKKACDNCRARKIKCDGEQPCMKCSSSSVNCLYTHVEKKRQVKKKEDKGSSIESLDNRMNKMESLLTTLIGKLNGDTNNYKTESSLSPDSKDTPESISNSSSPASPSDTTQQPEPPASFKKTESLPSNEQMEMPDEEKFIGSQSPLSVLSPKGVLWLSKKANDPNLANQFKNLMKKSHGIFYQYVKRWLDPIDSQDVVPIPPRSTMNEFVEYYKTELTHLEFIIPVKEIESILDQYYTMIEGNSKKIHFSNSNYLILNSLVALVCYHLMEIYVDDPEKLARVRSLEDRHLNNAIFYFHRVLILGEGLKTLQGLLLLVEHTNSTILPHANFTLISTTNRLAQFMGIHRVESLVGMSDAEKKRRRKIWWACYICDRTGCLKGGKPMTVSDYDMSPMTLEELKLLLLEDVPSEMVDRVLSDEVDLMEKGQMQLLYPDLEQHGFYLKPILLYFIGGFYKFTSEAYDALFCATALSGKSADQTMDVIETLNYKLDALNHTIPASIRPGSPVKLNIYDNVVDHHLLLLNFSYYLHVMIINRMAFKRSWLNHDHGQSDDNSKILPRQKRSIAKCLDAARTILRIIHVMEVRRCSILNVFMFVFYSAYFTLLAACLEFPTAPETKDDLLLMENTSEELYRRLIAHSEHLGDTDIFNVMKNGTGFFLRVAMLVYNDTNVNKIDTTKLEKELQEFEHFLDGDKAHAHRKRKRDHKNAYSPSVPSTLSNVRSRHNQGPAPGPFKNGFDQGRGPSQANTPDLNNILNDPISNNATGTSFDDSTYAASTKSASSTDGFDPFSLNEFDLDSNANVFQQLFPVPNLFFGGTAGDGTDGFPSYLT